MPTMPDKNPPQDNDDMDDKWPHTMRHYKWEKKSPENERPSSNDEPAPRNPRPA